MEGSNFGACVVLFVRSVDFAFSVTASEMFFGESFARSGLEIFFKIYGFFFYVEGTIKI